jgi:hypothetical protein
MRKLILAVLMAALLLTVSGGLASAGPAQRFASCGELRERFRYGVAISATAADKQVMHQHHRPKVKPAVYNANKRLDKDNDGTVCEVHLGA